MPFPQKIFKVWRTMIEGEPDWRILLSQTCAGDTWPDISQLIKDIVNWDLFRQQRQTEPEYLNRQYGTHFNYVGYSFPESEYLNRTLFNRIIGVSVMFDWLMDRLHSHYGSKIDEELVNKAIWIEVFRICVVGRDTSLSPPLQWQKLYNYLFEAHYDLGLTVLNGALTIDAIINFVTEPRALPPKADIRRAEIVEYIDDVLLFHTADKLDWLFYAKYLHEAGYYDSASNLILRHIKDVNALVGRVVSFETIWDEPTQKEFQDIVGVEY